MTQGISTKKRVKFPKSKESWLLLILLLGTGILPFFLNYGLFYKLKNTLPFEFEGKVLFSLPGCLEIGNFRIQERAFAVSSKSLTLRYQPLEFLKTGNARLEIQGRDASLTISHSVLNTVLPRIDFDSLHAVLQVSNRPNHVSIAYFSAQGKKMLVYSGGDFSKRDIHLALSCYLAPELLVVLPFSVAKHLFLKPYAALYEIKFMAEGTWKMPHFSLSSDLMRVEMKRR